MHQPQRGCGWYGHPTQGGSFLATLGFGTQSLRVWEMRPAHVVYNNQGNALENPPKTPFRRSIGSPLQGGMGFWGDFPRRCPDCYTQRARAAFPNPEGIASQSPGLRGTSYRGWDGRTTHNPNGVASSWRNPVGVDAFNIVLPRVGPLRGPTLGFATESLRDSPIAHPVV